MARSNRIVVPASKEMLKQMKYEIAGELGLYSAPAPGTGDAEFAGELGGTGSSSQPTIQWSTLATRQAGSVGGEITKRLVAKAEQTLHGL
jgi:hypothetical protein